MKFTVYTKFLGPKIIADKLPQHPEFSEVKTYRDGSADNVNVYMAENSELPPYEAIDHYLDYLIEIQPMVYAAGTRKTVIYYTYWPYAQGNTEFSVSQIKKVAELGAGLAITCATSYGEDE